MRSKCGSTIAAAAVLFAVATPQASARPDDGPMLAPQPQAAASHHLTSLKRNYLTAYNRVTDQIGTPPGRNIVLDGIRDGSVERPATAQEISQSLARLEDASQQPSAMTDVPAAVSATLQRIAQCESGGDPTRISANGKFRGKYQFTVDTWRSVGGTGDPAAASEREQDERAAALLVRSGVSPWPECGR